MWEGAGGASRVILSTTFWESPAGSTALSISILQVTLKGSTPAHTTPVITVKKTTAVKYKPILL
jgi:hypothetical protein